MLDVKSGQEAPFLNLNLLDLGDVGVDSRDVRIKERAVSEFGFIPPAKYGRDSLATIALPANRPKIIGVEPPERKTATARDSAECIGDPRRQARTGAKR